VRNCKWCGKEFDPGRYPSGQPRRTKLCHECQLRITIHKPRICRGCGKEFVVQGKARYTRVYCDECLARFQREQQEKKEQEKQRGKLLERLNREANEAKEFLKLQKGAPQHKEHKAIGFGDIFEAFFNPSKLSLEEKRMACDALSTASASLQHAIEQEEKRPLVEAAKKVDGGLKKFMEDLNVVADTGISWDSFVCDVLLQGKASEEDIKEFPHVATSNGRVFGQCENCHKYVEEKFVGQGFDPQLHLCYDWETQRELCPECFSKDTRAVV